MCHTGNDWFLDGLALFEIFRSDTVIKLKEQLVKVGTSDKGAFPQKKIFFVVCSVFLHF